MVLMQPRDRSACARLEAECSARRIAKRLDAELVLVAPADLVVVGELDRDGPVRAYRLHERAHGGSLGGGALQHRERAPEHLVAAIPVGLRASVLLLLLLPHLSTVFAIAPIELLPAIAHGEDGVRRRGGRDHLHATEDHRVWREIAERNRRDHLDDPAVLAERPPEHL